MIRKELIILILLAIIQFTNVMDFMVMMPLITHFKEAFQIDATAFTYLLSSYTVAAFIMGFAGAMFLDRFDRKKSLIMSYFFFALGTLACAGSWNFTSLMVARSVTGLFGGVLATTVLSIIGDLFPFERRATAMGIVMMGFSLAAVVGVPFGLILANHFSWKAPFFFIGLFAILITILLIKFIPSVDSHLRKSSTKPFEIYLMISKNTNQLLAFLFMFLMMLGQFTVIPFIADYMENNIGFTKSQIPLIYLVGGLCTVFSAPLVGRFSDRLGKKKVFVMMAILSMIPILVITQLPKVSIYLALIPTSLFFILISGRMIPAIALITSTARSEQRGSFMSINTAIQHLGASVASLLGGAIIAETLTGQLIHYDIVGYCAIICSILAIIVGLRLKAVG